MWSAINYSAYNSIVESIFALNGTYRYRIDGKSVSEWGIAAPSIIPTIAVGSLTGLTGDYNAKYTYARKEGSVVVCESNAGNPSDSDVTLANESLSILVSEPVDPQVNYIRFYRTAADGIIFYYDREINYGAGDYGYTQTWEEDGAYISGAGVKLTATNGNLEQIFSWESLYDQYTATDSIFHRSVPGDNIFHVGGAYVTTPGIDTNTADAALGTLLHEDHDRPPEGTYVAGPSFNGVCFILKDGDLYYCKSKQPEYWPAAYYVTVAPRQETAKNVVFFDQQPFVLTDRSIYYVEGTAHGSFVPRRLAAKTGTQSVNGVAAVEGAGIFHVGSDGLYLCMPATSSRLGKDSKITGGFNPIFYGESVNGVPAIGDLGNTFLTQYDNKLYFFYPGESDTYPTNALVFYLDSQRVGYCSWGTEFHHAALDVTNNRMVAITDGYSFIIEDESMTTDDGTVITWEVETMDYTLQTRRHFPRWVKYDVDASGATSANGYVILDGSVHQTHSITGERITKRRLITVGNGRRCSIRLSGSGPVEIRMVESE